jgi:hypothetical protein
MKNDSLGWVGIIVYYFVLIVIGVVIVYGFCNNWFPLIK